MPKPRLFIGSSSEQKQFAEALAKRFDDPCDVIRWWDGAVRPSDFTFASLAERAHEADFAVFVFAPDDVTVSRSRERPSTRGNVVLEAGLFSGVLGIRRSFILRDKGVEIPSDLKGLTTVDYVSTRDPEKEADNAHATIEKRLRELGLRRGFQGFWWQIPLTTNRQIETAALSFMKIWQVPHGSYRLSGEAWDDAGLLSRFESKATDASPDVADLHYYWEGTWVRDSANDFYGTGKMRIETANRGSGYYTTISKTHPEANDRTEVRYLRAEPDDEKIMRGDDDNARKNLVARRLRPA